jgi:hypothetical protein
LRVAAVAAVARVAEPPGRGRLPPSAFSSAEHPPAQRWLPSACVLGSLNRQEFISLVVRAAVMRHMQHGRETDAPSALRKLLASDIVPRIAALDPAVLVPANEVVSSHRTPSLGRRCDPMRFDGCACAVSSCVLLH